MAKPTADSQESCPVDPASRAVWLKQAGKPESPPTASSLLSSEGCDSSTIDQTPSPNRRPRLPIPGFQTKAALAHDREVSTIPRTAAGTIAPGSSPLANNEQESGKDEQTGNWIYPSEQMFFSAMRRKNYDPRVEDMQSIIPIHNAVNERAWKEIKDWESGWGSEKCGGPRLDSFSGTATKMTPKARINTILGYHAPFDRHDWIVDRCGTKVDYVIDFYAGNDEGKKGKSLNFYLDVRPKLNSWEGWKMRGSKLLGLS